MESPARVQLGDTVLVRIDDTAFRPLLISGIWPGGRISGTIFCEPDDYTRPVFRGAMDRQGDPASIMGRPSQICPVAYGKQLLEGASLGQWRRR